MYKVPDLLAVLRGAAGALGLARFLFSRDLTIAETFCRRFLWHELMLWPDDMPSRTVVALSHDDDLVPSPLVAAHLAHASPSTRVLYHPTAGHGGMLLDLRFQRTMVDALVAMVDCERGPSGATTPTADDSDDGAVTTPVEEEYSAPIPAKPPLAMSGGQGATGGLAAGARRRRGAVSWG